VERRGAVRAILHEDREGRPSCPLVLASVEFLLVALDLPAVLTMKGAMKLSLITLLACTATVRSQFSSDFEQWRFDSAVDKSMKEVKTLLDTTRNPQLLADDAAEHTWTDKFSVAEFVANTAIAAYWNALRHMLSLETETLQTLQKWVHEDEKNVILRFEAQDSFVFQKEVIDEVDLGKTDDEGLWESITRHKVVTKRTEYHWNSEIAYKVSACRGSCGSYEGGDDDIQQLTLVDRKRTATIITVYKSTSMQEKTIHEPVDLNLSWLIGMMEPGSSTSQFVIDRAQVSCRTPSRNNDIQESIRFAYELSTWTSGIERYFFDRVQDGIVNKHNPAKPEKKASLRDTQLAAPAIFNPILPLVENHTVISAATASIFLEEQVRTLTGKARDDLGEVYSPSQSTASLVSVDEAYFLLVCYHIRCLAIQFKDSIGYIENSLKIQLVQAIGRELTPMDFDAFMRFYYNKLFHPDFAPMPFSHAIRRPDHYPDGILSIEGNHNEQPVLSLMRRVAGNASSPFTIPIGAATSVEITGDRYLHGWMQNRFQDYAVGSTHLAARARQFSSFLVLVGTIAGPNKFVPKNAIILQNKDEVLIPLLTEVLPSAREFKDAIASLSPEQQEFAKTFRGMQLESSVFGVCVIQLKPQLEKLLDLPDGALTKEIELTQDLLSLFVDYQIPPDLLSFDGSPTLDVAEKLAAVKGYVKAVTDMIDKTKQRQLKEETRKTDMKAEMDYQDLEHPSVSPSSCPGVGPSAAPSSKPSSGPSARPRGGAESHRQVRQLARQSVPAEGHEKVLYASVMMAEETEPVSMMADETVSADTATERASQPKQATGSPVSFQKTATNDFTMIPKILDMVLERHDTDGAMKSVILSTGDTWTRIRQENLLSPRTNQLLRRGQVDAEKKKAMDLLDAISRSGSLPIDAAELHVIIGVAHCFDKSIIETVIQDNVNPIASVEKSLLLLAATILGDSTASTFLLEGTEARDRLEAALPSYFSLNDHATSNGSPSTTMARDDAFSAQA